MGKAVLISIQPKWCELIANGKKTVEVRKTKPKLETPFKVYIYMTKGNASYPVKIGGYPMTTHNNGGKVVIGEFVCDAVLPISITYSDPNSHIALREFPYTCLTDKEIMDYLGNGKTGYGWHISHLVIYDKPRELGEFKKHIRTCYYDHLGLATPKCADCKKCNLTRPPQSWCYVEEIS